MSNMTIFLCILDYLFHKEDCGNWIFIYPIRYILTDNDDIPISVVILSTNTHDIELVIDVIDIVIIKRPLSSSKKQDQSWKRKAKSMPYKVYNSKQIEQEILKRGHVLNMRYKRKRGEKKETEEKPCHKTQTARRRRIVENQLLAQQIQKTINEI